jgi:exodeoxyribonuclease III
MRLIAWNCCRGPMVKKASALEALAPDVAVLSEALAPERESAQLHWYPSNASRLGIQVRAFGPYTLRRLPRAELPNCVVPLRVVGPRSFNLLAVWTWPAPSYVKAFQNGLAAYARLLHGGPTVVAGDFNGNPVFDRHKPRARWWSAGFDALEAAGLVSADHRFHGVDYGAEPHATHHFLRKPERPFHIDFCFVPAGWSGRRLQVAIAHGPDWSTLSDHFPLVVETEAEA